jgi:hypothetical protein
MNKDLKKIDISVTNNYGKVMYVATVNIYDRDIWYCGENIIEALNGLQKEIEIYFSAED